MKGESSVKCVKWRAGLIAAALQCLPCAAQAGKASVVPLPDRITGAGELKIDAGSKARDTLRAIPPEAALERFALQDERGRSVSYAGLTDGDIGGVLFIDDKLAGTLGRDDTQLFYSCRGFVTATQKHWARDGAAWIASLQAAIRPADSVTLSFSGKSTVQSIKSVVENPLLVQAKALAGAGANPVELVKTLYKAHGDYRDHERDKELLKALGEVRPGTAEADLAKALNPESVTFVDAESLVMAYPRYSVEFFVSRSRVQEIQQPSFTQLAKERASLFYMQGVDWKRCTPADWRSAKSSMPAVADKVAGSAAGARAD
ncbi:MAG: hypothetical protein U1F63_15220 [Chitinivorax sp.]